MDLYLLDAGGAGVAIFLFCVIRSSFYDTGDPLEAVVMILMKYNFPLKSSLWKFPLS